MKVLWRYSAANPDWRATWCTSVDYSTMVLGYALKYLPDSFYPNYNSAIIEEGKRFTISCQKPYSFIHFCSRIYI